MQKYMINSCDKHTARAAIKLTNKVTEVNKRQRAKVKQENRVHVSLLVHFINQDFE